MVNGNYKTLFNFNDVNVKARLSFWLAPISLWVFLTWLADRRRKDSAIGFNLLIGALGTVFAMSADIGHALAHSFSAKFAAAPMDEIRLGLDMPRTIYYNNDIEPRQHILRALGGPIFSAIGFLVSIIWRLLSPAKSISRQLADISCISHGLILLGVFFPHPAVDGGTVLKCSLIEKGKEPEEVEKITRNASVGFGISLFTLAGLFIGIYAMYRKKKQW